MPKIPVLSDIIDIVDDDIQVNDDLFIDTEDNANLGVEIMDYHTEVVEEVVEEEAIPFALVEEKPKFQGGDANTFSAWVNKNLDGMQCFNLGFERERRRKALQIVFKGIPPFGFEE